MNDIIISNDDYTKYTIREVDSTHDGQDWSVKPFMSVQTRPINTESTGKIMLLTINIPKALKYRYKQIR